VVDTSFATFGFFKGKPAKEEEEDKTRRRTIVLVK